MKSSLTSAACAALWIFLLQTFPINYSPLVEASPLYSRDLSSLENATAAAIIYGYPIFPYIELIYPLLNSTGPNGLTLFPLATASAAPIVTSNVDTLYATAPIDLSQTDVEITIPAVPDGRYYDLAFYDFYGNNFANLGSVNNTLPGKYLLRQGNATFGVELCDNAAPYLGYVNYPTVYGTVYPRFVVRNNNSDIATVDSIRSQIVLTPIPPQNDCMNTNNAPPLSQSLLNTSLDYQSIANLFPGSLNASAANELLRLTAFLTPYNAPEIRNQSSIISQTPSLAGLNLTDGTYTPPPDLNLTLALQLVNETLALSAEPQNIDTFANDWESTKANISGDFKTDYATRAYIAYSGYMQLVPSEALYVEYRGPLLAIEGTNLLSIAANESLLFTFFGKPPVNGFWSLTAYGADHYLIPNSNNVYSLGDRSNLTYADGTSVYENNLTTPSTSTTSSSSSSAKSERDGIFQILMQGADVPPPANWSSNWLPAPARSGLFSVDLRFYGPTDAFRNGSYVEPLVTRQAAFTSS